MGAWDKCCLFIAHGFGSGLVPLAPGTFGTIVGIAWFLSGLYVSSTIWIYLLFCALGIALAIYTGARAEKVLGKKDPGQIVIDEICAVPICFLFLVWNGTELTKTVLSLDAWLYWLGVFALFRIFDIAKPWPLRQIQDLPGGIGLVIDDVGAAVYVNLAGWGILKVLT